MKYSLKPSLPGTRMTRFPILLAALLLATAAPSLHAQISLTTPGTAYLQDFSSFDTTTLAPMPAGWRVSKDNANVRTVSAYSAALTATERRGGNAMSSSAANGIYNLGAGDAATVTERSVGFIASSSGTKSGNVYAWFRNNTGGTIASFSISYNVEKYRGGTNAAGFQIQMYYSTDGSTWTPAGASFITSFSADAANAGYTPAPGATAAASGTIVTNVAASGDFYLAWNYSVVSGTTTSNAQSLAIDDVSVTPSAGSASQPTVLQFPAGTSSASEGAGTVTIPVTITNPSATTATTVDVVLTGGTATNGVDVVPAYSTQTLTFPAGSSASQSASFTIADDALFEGSETLIFSLQNAAGGTTASVSGQTTHTFTILENDPPPVPTVLVNEYYNGNGDISTFEAVELLVVKDSLDLRGYRVADATSGGTYPFGQITFSNDPLWSNVQAGTIIVIGGLFAVPGQDTDPSDGLIIVNPPPADTLNQYFISSTSIPSIAATSDAVAVLDAGGAFVHGLAHGSSNMNTLPASRHGWLSGSILSGQSVAFARAAGAMNIFDFMVPTYATAGLNTLGWANDTTGNREFLRSARSRTIVHNRTLAGTFFWNVTVNGPTVTAAAPVNIGGTLTINDGTVNENGQGLSFDANGNAQNGTGSGSALIGNGAGSAATLNFTLSPFVFSGTMNAGGSDATVEYLGSAAQQLVPGTYHNLKLTNGNAGARKRLAANSTVNGTLTIGAGVWFDVDTLALVTLGSTGTFTNAGRFLGSIRTTRTLGTLALTENFGGIGMSITPTAAPLPGSTTVTMHSGTHRWVGNLPSILKSYTVNAAVGTGLAATLVARYESTDLNGQTEAALALKYSADNGVTWSSPAGTLNTAAKNLTHSATVLNGIWTAHANPPQGTIVTAPVAISFEAEQNYTVPAPRTVNVTNLNGSGSLIQWTATSSTVVAPTWLSITPSPAAGLNAGAFDVAVTRTDLAPGVYTGSVTLLDPHATNSPYVIPVTFTVQAPRLICVGADTIVIKATPKRGDAKKDVMVLNCGGTFGPDVILWNVATSTSWLTITPTSGSEGQVFTLTAPTSQMSPSTLHGSITLTGTLSVRGTPVINSPLTIPVRLEVETVGEQIASTGSMNPGETRVLRNPQGHAFAILKLNAGTLSGLTVRMLPDALPSGITRLRYAMRHYLFEAAGSGYNLDLTMFYTSNELVPFMAIPSQLRGWRQFPVGGVWYPTTSSASPINNSVTVTGITDLSGAWTMAGPYAAIQMPVRGLRALRTSSDAAALAWQSELAVTRLGFIVERSPAGRNEWQTVGFAAFRDDGMYTFNEKGLDADAQEYRLIAFDPAGEAYQSADTRLDPWGILAAGAVVSPVQLALQQSAPNPAPAGTRITIRYAVPEQGRARIAVYDKYGRELRVVSDADVDRGSWSAFLDTDGFAAGTYFIRLQFGASAVTRSMTIVR